LIEERDRIEAAIEALRDSASGLPTGKTAEGQSIPDGVKSTPKISTTRTAAATKRKGISAETKKGPHPIASAALLPRLKRIRSEGPIRFNQDETARAFDVSSKSPSIKSCSSLQYFQYNHCPFRQSLPLRVLNRKTF
jgi:hypothetical protein